MDQKVVLQGIKAKEDKVNRQLWLLEREKQMDNIAKKKIELERVRQERELFDEMERKKKLEVSAISELLGKSSVDNMSYLQKALNRAENLEKAVYSKKGGFND